MADGSTRCVTSTAGAFFPHLSPSSALQSVQIGNEGRERGVLPEEPFKRPTSHAPIRGGTFELRDGEEAAGWCQWC